MMASATKVDLVDVVEIAEREGFHEMELIQQAVDDGIITGSSGANNAYECPGRLHLAGSVDDFEIYVRRLAVSSR